MKIPFDVKMLTSGASLLEQEKDSALLKLSKDGAGIVLPWDVMKNERYFMFKIETLEEHCDAFNVYVYGKDDEPTMTIRFGILPQITTQICLDKEWFKAGVLFPEALPGELKIVCHGGRIVPEEITRIEMKTIPVFHDITVRISNMALTDTYPEDVKLLNVKLVDSLGQNKRKERAFLKNKLKMAKKAIHLKIGQNGAAGKIKSWPRAQDFLQNIRQMASGGWQIRTVMRFSVQDQTA